MPRMDGTGPAGCGLRAGRRNAGCRHGAIAGSWGQGTRRCIGGGSAIPQCNREALNAIKAALQERLAAVEKQLDTQ